MPRVSAMDGQGNIFIAGQSVTDFDDLGNPTRISGFLMKRDSLGEWFDPFGGNRYRGDEPWQGVRVWTPKTGRQTASVSSMKLLSTGKILAGGQMNNRMFVSRLTVAGKLDRTFGPWRGQARRKNKGTSIADFEGRQCRCVTDAVIATDRRGRIYQAGTAFSQATRRIATVVIARYLQNGAIDRTFGKGGYARAVRNPFTKVSAIAVQRNGRVVVAGQQGYSRNSKLMLLRFLSNGKLDETFFNQGAMTRRFGDAALADDVKIDSEGRIVVAGGFATQGVGNFLVGRIRP